MKLALIYLHFFMIRDSLFINGIMELPDTWKGEDYLNISRKNLGAFQK